MSLRPANLHLVALVLISGCHLLGGSAAAPAAQPAAAPAAPAAPAGPNAVAPHSPADRVRPMAAPAAPMATAPAAQQGPSLYDRLGGLDAIRAVVHDFRSRVAADTRINGFFRGVNLDSLEHLIGDQVCQVTGGPCTYGGRSMREAHAGLNIRDDDFNALVEDLGAALDAASVQAREKGELLAALASLKGDIVGH
jgi:hemoglobin